MKRITVTVTDWQDVALHELSDLEEAPISYLVRQALNAMLPTQLELARFLRDPSTRPGDALAIADNMEALMKRISGSGAGVAGGDEAPPRARNRPVQPPSGNTGVNPS